MTNEAKLAANRTTTGARPPRGGHSAVSRHRVLRRLRARHEHLFVGGRDYCDRSHARSDHTASPSCRSVRADTVDHAVTNCLLDAISGGEAAL